MVSATVNFINRQIYVNKYLIRKAIDKVPYFVLRNLETIGLSLSGVGYINVLFYTQHVFSSYFKSPAVCAGAAQSAGLASFIFGACLTNKIAQYVSQYREQRALQISQKEDKPFGLIIQAASDHNGAFSASGCRLYTCDKAIKKYNLRKVTVKNESEFFQAIELAAAGQSKKISLLWIQAHGSHDSIQLGDGDAILWKDSIGKHKSCLNRNLNKHSITVLSSCSTAKGEGNFACEFSKYAHGKVYAPEEDSAGPPVFHKNGIVSLISNRNPYTNITKVYENEKVIDC